MVQDSIQYSNRQGMINSSQDNLQDMKSLHPSSSISQSSSSAPSLSKIAQLLSQTLTSYESQLDTLSDTIQTKFNDTVSPRCNPHLLLARLQSLQKSVLLLEERITTLQKRRLVFGERVQEGLRENSKLLGKILSVTEFGCDCTAVNAFSQMYETMLENNRSLDGIQSPHEKYQAEVIFVSNKKCG